jgi:hypothetical protein
MEGPEEFASSRQMTITLAPEAREAMKQEQLKKLKNKRWESYKNWKKCHCPALNAEIHFTQDGFHHLHTEPSGTVRTVSEQLHKYSNLVFVQGVIKNPLAVLTYSKRFAPLGRRGGKRNKKPVMKEFEYWSIKSKVKGKSIKVILRKLVNSQKIIFWSVMG